jgi:hypothetical protein
MTLTYSIANSTSTTSFSLSQGTAALIAITIATITPTYSTANSTSTTTTSLPKFTRAASQSSIAFSVVSATLAFSFLAM